VTRPNVDEMLVVCLLGYGDRDRWGWSPTGRRGAGGRVRQNASACVWSIGYPGGDGRVR